MKEDKTEVNERNSEESQLLFVFLGEEQNNPENLKKRIQGKKSQSFLQGKETVFT